VPVFTAIRAGVTKLSLLNCSESALSHLLGRCEIKHLVGTVSLGRRDLRAQQLHADLLNHFGKWPRHELDFFQLESCGAQVINVGIDRLSVGNASDPRKKAIQLLGQRRTAREVAKGLPVRLGGERARIRERHLFYWKSAEGASQMIVSNDLSGKGKFSASPRSNRARDDNTLAEASSPASATF